MPNIGITQASKVVGISRTTIYKAIENGDLTAHKNNRGHNTVEVSELQRWADGVNTPNANQLTEVSTRLQPQNADIDRLNAQVDDLKRQLEEAKQREQQLHGHLERITLLLPQPAAPQPSEIAPTSTEADGAGDRVPTEEKEPSAPQKTRFLERVKRAFR